ncbi:phage baseplate assembly protein V [Scytonema sp. PCC 10023]|uniref:phage baseplate assembly protein V n=1 Tax=Scytonema sp. PCC 10023 TaxID=1680591 RepID=UPI0039C6385F
MVFTPPHRETRERYPGLYVGQVEGNDLDLGRIQVSIPSVFDETDPDFFVQARPCFPYGHFFVPEVGDKVWLAFENGNPSNPVWLGIWYPEDTVPDDTQDANPKQRLIRSSTGHLMHFDDENGQITIQDANGNTITLNDQGITIEAQNNTVTLNSQGITLTDATGSQLEITSLKTWLQGFTNVFTTAWTPVPQDGGAALNTAMSTYLSSNPLPM